MKPQPKYYKQRLLIILLMGVVVMTFAYLTVLIVSFIAADYPWYQKAVAFLLLFAEAFGLVHSIGYFLNIINVLSHEDTNISKQPAPPLSSYPPVAIVIPSYKEDVALLKDTLICVYNLTYPNKQLYLLDDTRYDRPWDTPEVVSKYRSAIDDMCQWMGVNLFRRKWRGAKAGIINDFVNYVSGRPQEGMHLSMFQAEPQVDVPKYIIVFDADVNALPNFVEDLVAHMEANDKVAFIQTPQYYSNFEANRVARAAGLQQVIFFEYICEGKSLDQAMFCCGTNVMLRREALLSVGGFDETSVTEDFATSLKMHLKGWQTLYFNKVCAFGMGPEDLGAYFKQQFRWALGTMQMLRQLPLLMIHNYRKCTLACWWSYFLSSSHYLIGVIFLIMFLFPIAFLFFNIPAYFVDPRIYTAVFIPYIFGLLTMSSWALNLRQFRPRHMLQIMVLNSVTFPVFVKASIYALLGIKGSFVVTPKGQSGEVPMKMVWPQLLALLFSVAAITWGVERIYYERYSLFGLVGNVWWAIYNFLVLSWVFYFMNPEKKQPETE